MKILFNKDGQGQKEIKKVLGFLDAAYTFDNLLPDIELNTPYIMPFVGEKLYDKIHAFYVEPSTAVATKEVRKHKAVLKNMQLFIASMAYLDYAPNNDLSHGNDGRNMRTEDDERAPWDWQIAQDNSALKKRAYKALDNLMRELDRSEWAIWKTSEAYKIANSLLITNTQNFDKVLPINNSGQLYYRMVSFMEDKEQAVCAVTGTPLFLRLHDTDLDASEKAIKKVAQKAIAYAVMEKAYQLFPIEMLEPLIVGRDRAKQSIILMDKRSMYYHSEAKKYLIELETKVSKQNEQYDCIDPLAHISGKGHINL